MFNLLWETRNEQQKQKIEDKNQRFEFFIFLKNEGLI
jgi:hypothetical protein